MCVEGNMKNSVFALLLFGSFLFSPAQADDCRKLVDLYNRATESQDFGEKETLFKQALALGCGQKRYVAEVHNNLCDAYENAGRLLEAVAEYKGALDVDPSLATPYFGLGDVYSKMKDFKSAGQYYDQYRRMAGFKSRRQLVAALSLKSATRSISPVPAEDLYFGFDEVVLGKESEKQFEELLAALKEDELQSHRFRLIGHTCDIGREVYNQQLSERRATAVRDWLVSHHYSAGQLETLGLGETRPVADNGTEEGRRLNRRVEIRTVAITLGEARRAKISKEGAECLERGQRLLADGSAADAIIYFEKALEWFDKDGCQEGKQSVWGNLYLAYQQLGNMKKARECLEAFQGGGASK
jgi:outer membrane protein OmpA-like peptidoglycan-associated protein